MFRFLCAVALAFFALAAQAAVDVNKASQAELESVKGIGPGLSVKILDARKQGNFKDWADLVGRVGGVGTGNANRFSQAGLTVAGTAFSAVALPAPGDMAKSGKNAVADKAAAPRSRKAAAGEATAPAVR